MLYDSVRLIGYVIRIDMLRQHEMNEVKCNMTFVPPKEISLLKIPLTNLFDFKLRSAIYLCFLRQLLKFFINNGIALIISISRVLYFK